MTTIKGYKLVCEWCNCKSESLWEVENPDKEVPDTKPWYTNTPSCFDGLYMPDGWSSRHLSREVSKEYKAKEAIGLGFWRKPKEKTIKTPYVEDKFIYFCCYDHAETYKRALNNCNDGWK